MARLYNGRWMADANVNGSRKRVMFDTQAQAEAFEANPHGQLHVSKTKVTIGKMFPKWARECYGGTANERNALRIADELVDRLGADVPVENIDRKMVKALVAELHEHGNANSTINTKTSTLSRLLNYAVDEEVIEHVPKIPFFSGSNNRVRSLTREEEEDIFAHFSPSYLQYGNFLLGTGCRPSEALRLQKQDISGGSVTFWKTKTDKPRTIPLTGKAKEAIAWAKEKHPIPNAHNPARRLPQASNFVFSTICYDTFYNEWNRAVKLAGYGNDDELVPYVLRHTCATRLAQGGMSELRLMKWMGHKSLATTRRYTHLTVDDLQVGVRILEG